MVVAARSWAGHVCGTWAGRSVVTPQKSKRPYDCRSLPLGIRYVDVERLGEKNVGNFWSSCDSWCSTPQAFAVVTVLLCNVIEFCGDRRISVFFDRRVPTRRPTNSCATTRRRHCRPTLSCTGRENSRCASPLPSHGKRRGAGTSW